MSALLRTITLITLITLLSSGIASLGATLPTGMQATLAFTSTDSRAPYGEGELVHFFITNDGALCVGDTRLSEVQTRASGPGWRWEDPDQGTAYEVELDGTDIFIRQTLFGVTTGFFEGRGQKVTGSICPGFTRDASALELLSAEATQLLALAEIIYPDIFHGGGPVAQSQGYTYRFYKGSGVYVGIKDERVFLQGGPYGSTITEQGSVKALLAYVKGIQVKRRNAANARAQVLLRSMVEMNWNSHGATTTGAVLLTHLPMDLADIGSITPLGLTAAGHVTPVDHIYLSPVVFESAPATYPVYIVADGLISEISTRPNHLGTGVEYRVVLQHSGTFYSYYDLIDELAPEITSQIPAGALDSGKIFRGPLSVSSGQLLGRIGGKTLDFANVNLETFLSGFINAASYVREAWKLFTVDSFSAFSTELGMQLMAKNLRVSEPRGGRIDYDVADTLSGNWFLEGSNGYAGIENDTSGKPYWSGHLAIVPFVHDPAYIIVSLGDYQGEALQFGVRGNAPQPTEVTVASGLLKWELTQPPNGPPPIADMSHAVSYGSILLQVLTGEKLKVEIFPGKLPEAVNDFTSAAQLYVR